MIGYVTFVFDDQTVKIQITQQDRRNRYRYNIEEKVKIADNNGTRQDAVLRSIASHSLIEALLYKKIRVEVFERDSLESLVGKINVLG